MSLSALRRFASMGSLFARANVRRLARPAKVNFALTYWCQYRCKTCNIWKKKPENELSTAEILAFVARNRNVSWLDLTGGEIFLRQDLEEILQAIVTSWKSLAILHYPTNGFLTDQIERITRAVARRGGPTIIITVSVDGDQALNDDIRGIKGGYERQVATYRALKSIPGVRPIFGMTLSRYNVGAFERTFAALAQSCPGLTIDDVHLNVAQVSGHYYANAEMGDVRPSRQQAAQELRVYRQRRGSALSPQTWLEDTYLRHLESYIDTGTLPMRCHSLRSSCFIDPWGTVFPCITYSRPVGSLRDHGMDLSQVWHSETAVQVQREIWVGNCPQCWTACEAYQSILGNLFRPASVVPVHPRPRTLVVK
jgi:radical SAM protein with 4Fe4S-binding SPASM domain